MQKRSEFETRRHSLKLQMKALRKMQAIFPACAYLECYKDCVFGIEMCGKLNHLPSEFQPYMANIHLDSIFIGGERNVDMSTTS